MPNPWIILAFLLALASTFEYGHHMGYKSKETEDQIQIAKLNDQARQTEQDAADKVNNLSTKLVKANQNAKVEIQKRDAAIATGALRLSIVTRSVPTPTSTASSSGDSIQTRTELDPTTAQSLVSITDQGDSNTRQLNACIDAYNTVFQTINGKKK